MMLISPDFLISGKSNSARFTSIAVYHLMRYHLIYDKMATFGICRNHTIVAEGRVSKNVQKQMQHE